MFPPKFRRPFDGPVVISQGYANENPMEPGGFLLPSRDIVYAGGGADSLFGHWHNGVDYAVAMGSRLVAPFGGVVALAGISPSGFGLRVVIRHWAGLCTLYGHLSVITVQVGQRVAVGDLIGWSGGANGDDRDGNSTGAHLHWSFLTLDSSVYHDPVPYVLGSEVCV